MNQRSSRFDNLRALLILLVVFGHCQELIQKNLLYRVIYSFHVPAFIFLSGYFARPSLRRIASMTSVYIVFQILYLVYDAIILHGQTHVAISFRKPYWLLWFQFTLLIYMLITPLFVSLSKRSPIYLIGILGLSVILSLYCGYNDEIGYNYSLSRTLCFFPFYIAGFFCCHYIAPILWADYTKLLRKALLALSFLFVLFTIFYLKKYYYEFLPAVFYGSYSYSALDYGVGIQLRLHLIACGWIVFLVLAVPDRRIPLLTVLGRNTYPLFLLHGFVIRLLKKASFFCYSPMVNTLWALFITLLLAALFGNNYVSRCFQAVFIRPFSRKKQEQ